MSECPDFTCYYEGHNRREPRGKWITDFYHDDQHFCANIGQKKMTHLATPGGRHVLVPRYYDTENDVVLDGRFVRETTGNRRLKPIIRGLPITQTYDHFVKIYFGLAKETGFTWNDPSGSSSFVTNSAPLTDSLVYLNYLNLTSSPFSGGIYFAYPNITPEYFVSFVNYFHHINPFPCSDIPEEPVLPDKPIWWNDDVLNPYFNWGWDGSMFPPFKRLDGVATNISGQPASLEYINSSIVNYDALSYLSGGGHTYFNRRALIGAPSNSGSSPGDEYVLLPLFLDLARKRIVLRCSLLLYSLKVFSPLMCASCFTCSGDYNIQATGSTTPWFFFAPFFGADYAFIPVFRFVFSGCDDNVYNYCDFSYGVDLDRIGVLEILVEFPFYSDDNPYGDLGLGGPGFVSHLRNCVIFEDTSKITVSGLSSPVYFNLTNGSNCSDLYSYSMVESGSFSQELVNTPVDSSIGNNVVAISSDISTIVGHYDEGAYCTSGLNQTISWEGWARSFVSIVQGISQAGLEG